ncbi:TPA: hypothetical protein ACX3CS_004627 [Vibrio parahaemolyticus]
MVKETINSLKGVLYERISSPLWGTYFISFVVYNWSAILILTSDPKPMAEKVELIKTTYVYTDGNFNMGVVLYPLMMSVFLLLAIPFLQTLHYIYSEYMKTQGKVRRDKFEEKTRLTVEQSNELRQRIFNIQTSSREMTSFQDQEINSLKETISSLKSQLESSEQDEEMGLLVEQLQRVQSEKAELSAKVAKVELELANSRAYIKTDAVDIEYAFARIIGNETGARGTEHDADVFRGGDISHISDALDSAIASIELRLNRIHFFPSDNESGGIAAQLGVAIMQLKRTSKSMKELTVYEPNDYHWGIVANLMTVINTLLELAERNETNKKFKSDSQRLAPSF